MDSNRDAGIAIDQPRSLAERRAAAAILVDRFGYDLPLAIDPMEGPAETAYSAWPERLYVVGKGGSIVYQGGLGPFEFAPEEMERALADHLARG
jgi:type I thyroxine 5'-deiodinase